MNQKNWINGTLALAAIITFLLMREILGLAWDAFRLPVIEDLGVSAPDLLSAILGGLVFVLLKKSSLVNGYLNDVVQELSKVTWAVRKDTIVAAGVVMVMLTIASIILVAIDVVWGSLTRSIFHL